MLRIEHIIFDLDGTLIDSAPIILDGFKNTLNKFGYKPQLEINNNLIGPPLIQTLKLLSGENSENKLNDMALNFKIYYDSEACTRSLMYPGIKELLDFLKDKNINIHLATNKRSFPTKKILSKLSLETYFKSLYCIDQNENIYFLNKNEMLKKMIKNENIIQDKTIYIGDRIDDKEASEQNSIEFWLAAWGYGDYKDMSFYPKSYTSPKKIEKFISAMI